MDSSWAGANTSQIAQGGVLGGYVGNWLMITGTRNSTNGNQLFYDDSFEAIGGKPPARSTAGGIFTTRMGGNTARQFDGIIDRCIVYNKTLSISGVVELYNGGAPKNCSELIGSASSTGITESYNASAYEKTETTFNLLFKGYDLNISTNANLTYNGTLYPGTIIYSNSSYVSFVTNATVPFTYYNNSAVNFEWDYIMRHNNGTNTTGSTITKTQQDLWNLTYYPRVNITASSFGVDIASFTANSSSLSLSTTTEEIYFYRTSNGAIPITLTAGGYATATANITFNQTFYNYDFNLYTTNSINIIIKDENTGNNITDNVSIKFYSSDYGEWFNYTTTAGLYIDELNTSEWQLTFSSGNYSARSYIITVANGSFQELTAYLSQNVSQTLFTITDKDTAQYLQNVLMTMYRNIDSIWQPVESKYTDITGRAEFSYTPGANYKFFASKESYNDYVFYLEPILFSEYSVQMEKDALINSSMDYENIAIIYAPSVFLHNNLSQFNFIIQNPTGELIEYGFNLTYPGGFNSTVGYNALGGQLSAYINVTNATVWDSVRLDYYYITTLSGRRDFTAYLGIEFDSLGNNTFIKNKTQTYGLGIFERLLISTIIVIFVMGISTLIGRPLEGGALSLMMWIFLAYIGFIPLWAIIITLIVGILFLTWKSGG